MTEKLGESVKLWHLLLGLVVTCLGGAASFGMTYAQFQIRLDEAESEIASLKRDSVRLGRIERNIVRIATKLDVAVEDPE